ncbi:type II toxin-antitoxin system HicB family antitoxin [Patescibacteria group bacterium]|nr:type II toxin-antitoxin system HicB family antitoxin [Patescibacteria group bacterium]MBU1349665.1 type II toxin-antitoxin system HicB family antitoxin [Patescibacteria group bacterium]MBU1421375.1 type II toxin-antitoxin system HicB family antitoxin [Patescibacteria group bacterium]MBU1683945.1 type II toxin-antitoxin system HicB family antitoxin [Patescibacteria group bacterium]MBU1778562.1 type II toxin-antitoxin system HicB family antitoxin [Patescibacteria group bacterium]
MFDINKSKNYLFKAEVEKEEDGRWSAVIPSLPGCNAWGYSKSEALLAVQNNAQAYIETLIEDNQPVPLEEEIIQIPIKSPVYARAVAV